jgi:hypothetical protein
MPKLSEVLSGASAAPWDLPAFEKFLEANYCSEVLQFTTEVESYQWYYDIRTSRGKSLSQGEFLTTLKVMYDQILDTFIVPNSEHEINIPGEVRETLLSQRSLSNPPSPSVFQPACNMMYDLMAGIFIQFLRNGFRVEVPLPAAGPKG